ncbi:MAG: carboxypeptidase regulatory-like domain-containing protein, partial [Candidatus Hydrogenedentes bacterium]|nr:carboxypeptidase regulatory-like domain-containing protein [Candidatus Hydrogenedentota bacterium]
MNQNTRFYLLVACVLVVVAGLFYFVRGGNIPAKEKEASATAPKSDAPDERDNLDAPEISSQRHDARLTATSSRSAARDDEPKKGPRVGDAAIRGEVTLEEDNLPIEGAEISIYWSDPNAAVPTYDEEAMWKTTTNARGLYRVDKLPDGRFAVIAKKDELAGFSSAFIRPLLREPDDHVADVQLAPAGTISGTVVDEQQQPVNGALIALGRGKSGERDIYGGDNQAKSAADGTFT